MHTSLIVASVIVVIAVAIISRGMRIVPQQTAWIVERFGRYHQTLSPGLNLIIPLIDTIAYKFDLREVPTDVAQQVCITKDNVQIAIDGIVFLQITDAKQAAYGTSNPMASVEALAQTLMRNDIGNRNLDDVLSKRGELNNSIVTELDNAATNWGVKILRYEIRDIAPPKEVVAAMEKQLTADRERRAMIAKSEGDKAAAINIAEGEKAAAIARAEGERQSAILRAEGDAEAIQKIAEANKNAIQLVSESLSKKEGQDAMHMKIAQDFIAQWGGIAKKSTTVVVPANMGDLAGTLGTFMKIVKSDEQGDQQRS